MSSPATQLKLRLTITADEHPELFESLRRVADFRRRTRRLKDLATKGLLMEMWARTGNRGPVWTLPSEQKPPSTPIASSTSVDDQLDWTGGIAAST